MMGRCEARSRRATELRSLLRHGNHLPQQQLATTNKGKRIPRCYRHDEAQRALRKSEVEPNLASRRENGVRDDGPSLPHMVNAYTGALKGASFKSFNSELDRCRASGAFIERSRQSRHIPRQLLSCFFKELRCEDKELLECASDITITSDTRGRMMVIRMRCTLRTLPHGLAPSGSKFDNNVQRTFKGAFGKYVHSVDRILALRKQKPSDEDAVDLSRHMVDAVSIGMCTST